MALRLFILAILVAAALSAPKKQPKLQPAAPCGANSQCALPDCRCLSVATPGDLEASETPQFVLLTFDDAITTSNYAFYQEAFTGRTNPDGCPIQATFYMSHDYTDYSRVHSLHAQGHEIASHSITHNIDLTYWDNLSVEGHIDEFGGGREIISHFGNIPIEDVQGIRVPSLQLGGNNSFEALRQLGMTYDSSWPTQDYMNPALWPYTLDYASTQDCPIGKCPDASIPGVWVQPMVNWNDNEGYICSMVDACVYVPTDVDGLFDFMVRNFQRHHDGNKAPFGFYLHAAWFVTEEHFEAYLRFLDYIQSYNDVYIVSTSRAIEWTRHPTPLSDLQDLWPECQPTHEPSCTGTVCELDKGEETRWMTQCAPGCPAVYPWLGNPLGLASH